MFKDAIESGLQKTLGEVYFLKGEFAASVDYLQSEKKNYLQTNKLRLYYNSCNMLLRAYLEMDDEVNLQLVKQELQNIVIREDSEMTSRLYYTLGINAFLDSKKDQALKFFNQSFNVALSESNKEDMAYALMGKAIWYKDAKEYEKVISILENIKLFTEGLSAPEVETSCYIVESQILTSILKYDEALNSLWKAYSCANKRGSISFLTSYVLMQFGIIYTKLKKFDFAENYLNLVGEQIRKDEHKRTYAILESAKKDLAEALVGDPDLVIDLKDNKVLETGGRVVDFKNQFILLSLLLELANKQKSFISKESMSSLLWDEEYDPSRHDNKIYVTIRRLRKLIEPNSKTPRYVLKSKEGYTFNKKVNVLITE